MARLPRTVFPGLPHHVAQKGSGDKRIFESESDYRLYLQWLREYAERYGVEIWAYCLMPNRIDFVCVPRDERSLALAFNALHMRYAQFANGRTGSRGPLWRSRFLSCALDDLCAREDVRYIEMMPVRTGLVAVAGDYPWSSARARIMGDKDPLTSGDCPLNAEFRDWRAFLIDGPDDVVVRRIRERLKTGRPAGDAEFVKKLEGIAGRRLEAMPRGRPRKSSILGVKDSLR